MGVVVVVATDVLRLWVFFYGRRAGFVYLFPNRAALPRSYCVLRIHTILTRLKGRYVATE